MGIKDILQEGVSYIADLEDKLDNANKYIAILERDIAAVKKDLDSLPKPPEPWEQRSDRVIAAGYVLDELGVPYVFGGETIKGMDCSGFTQFLYKLVGVNLPRVSKDQATVGMELPKDNMAAWRRGDLLFFDYSKDGVIDHVGIYLGDGTMLHTNTPQTGINIKKVASPVAVRRIL